MVGVAIVAAAVVLLVVALRPQEPVAFQPLTPAQEEKAFLKDLEATGKAPEGVSVVLERTANALWNATFAAGEKQLEEHERGGALLDRGEVMCFKGGCKREVRLADRAAARIFEDHLLIGPKTPLRRWPGRVYRGPIVDDPKRGGVRAIWALLIDPHQHKKLEGLLNVPSADAEPGRSPSNRTMSTTLQ